VRMFFMFAILFFICGFSLRKPFIGVCTILATLILRDTMILETYHAFVDYHCYQILYIFTIMGVVISRPDAMGGMMPSSATDWGMLGFYGILVASALVNGVEIMSHKYIDLFLKAMVLYFLLSRLCDTPKRVRIAAIIAISATTFLVYLAFKKYRSGELSNARPYGITPIHEFGLQLSITFPLIGAMLADRWPKIVRFTLFMCLPLYVLVTLRCSSRSAYLGVGFGLAMLLWYHRRHFFWCLLATPLIFFAVTHQTEEVSLNLESIWTHRLPTGEKDTSIQMRIEQMRTAMAIIQSNPVFGLGPRQFFRQYNRYVDLSKSMGWSYTMHSVPLLIACEEGVVGFLIYYGLIVLGALRDGVFVVKRTRGDPKMLSVSCVAAGCLMGYIGFLVFGLAQPQMWIANIYVTVAIVTASRRVTNAYLLRGGVVVEDSATLEGVHVPHNTQLVFS